MDNTGSNKSIIRPRSSRVILEQEKMFRVRTQIDGIGHEPKDNESLEQDYDENNDRLITINEIDDNGNKFCLLPYIIARLISEAKEEHLLDKHIEQRMSHDHGFQLDIPTFNSKFALKPDLCEMSDESETSIKKILSQNRDQIAANASARKFIRAMNKASKKNTEKELNNSRIQSIDYNAKTQEMTNQYKSHMDVPSNFKPTVLKNKGQLKLKTSRHREGMDLSAYILHI